MSLLCADRTHACHLKHSHALCMSKTNKQTNIVCSWLTLSEGDDIIWITGHPYPQRCFFRVTTVLLGRLDIITTGEAPVLFAAEEEGPPVVSPDEGRFHGGHSAPIAVLHPPISYGLRVLREGHVIVEHPVLLSW